MGSAAKLKETFDVVSKHGAFYTGGNIEWHEDTLYCQTDVAINLLDCETGSVKKSIGLTEAEEIDSIHNFTTDGNRLITSHKSGLLKLWTAEGLLEKSWKFIHKGPIARLNLKEAKLATGGSDGVVRIWDLDHQACILALRGCQGVINVVEFHDNGLFASGDDGKINYYDLSNGQLKTVYDTHFSKVTSLVFCGDYFVTCGRDKVIVLWQLGNSTPVKTTAVYEAVEVIVALPTKFKLPDFKSQPDGAYVASAGENGIVRVWDAKTGTQVYAQTNSYISKAQEEGGLAITHLMFDRKSKNIAVVSVDQNIVVHHLKSFACVKQFIGFSDEILDVAIFGDNDSHFAVATNSKDVKLYENASMTCQLLKGHEDLVLCLAVHPADRNLLVSGAKDNSVRVWQLLGGSDVKCIGIGKRHTGSVNSLAFFHNESKFVSASHDTCIKLWDLTKDSVSCQKTVIAHQKEINCVSVSPNDKIIATASQDKTVKLWSDMFETIGILKGHKRGVWNVKFSPIDQVVATSSADCTIKLWSVTNYNCLKTIEGHEASVLRVEFLAKGMQLLSGGADGLIKLFNIKDSECQVTLDEHEGRVWALAVNRDESAFISGASDSVLIKWKDATEDRIQQRQKEMEELTLAEQKLSNYLQSEQLLKALKLSLKLEKPHQTLKIIKLIIKKGDDGLSETVKSLRNDQKESLLNCALNWNMNSKHAHPAQLVMKILLNELQTGDFRPTGLHRIAESALPYTERHFKRLTQMMQDINLVRYTMSCMQPHVRTIGE